jgi:HPt (histidine-containing phosphotransfer) domain-containing protein
MLGQVFTPEKHRQKGVSSFLIGAAIQHFESRGGRALYLNTGNPVAQRIYENFGCRPYNPPNPDEAHIFRRVSGSESQFDEWLFAPDATARIREVTRGDWTWFEALLNLPSHPWHLKDAGQGGGHAPYESQFLELMDDVEQKAALRVVLETSDRRMTGAAKISPGSAVGSSRSVVGVLDVFAHPNYFSDLDRLVHRTLSAAATLGIRALRALAASGDKAKIGTLLRSGFKEIERTSRKCATATGAQDSVTYWREV